MWNRSRPTSGILALSLLALGLLALTGCNYTFRAGSGLPAHVRTMAVVPFENDTGRFELTDEVHRALMERLPGSFGVQAAGEGAADAVVRGTIRRYEDEAPLFRPGEEGRIDVIERQVSIVVHVEIVDVRENVILWDASTLTARGEYLEAGETEEIGREAAIDRLVQSIIDGLQSDW